MVVKVVGHWETGWQSPKNEYDLWTHPLREFDIDNFYMVPITGINKKGLIEKETLENVTKENEDLIHVYLHEDGKTDLRDFIHPENCLYIAGKTSRQAWNSCARPNDINLKIPTHRNSGGIWGHQAMILVLYDRYIKGSI